jgi:hypothetical protein
VFVMPGGVWDVISLAVFILRGGSDTAKMSCVLFLDTGRSRLWYQGMSRVMPGQCKCRAGVRGVRIRFGSIEKTNTASMSGVELTAQAPTSRPTETG